MQAVTLMLITLAPTLAAWTMALAREATVPAFLRASMSPPPGFSGSKAREDWRIEMITACGATPATPSGAPGGGGGTSGSSGWPATGSPGPFDGWSSGGGSGGGGGGGGGGGWVCVTVTGTGGGGGAIGGGGPPGGGGAASVAGGPAGGGNAGTAGSGAGIGAPWGAAAITEATIGPCECQSISPSPPMT